MPSSLMRRTPRTARIFQPACGFFSSGRLSHRRTRGRPIPPINKRPRFKGTPRRKPPCVAAGAPKQGRANGSMKRPGPAPAFNFDLAHELTDAPAHGMM